MHINKYSIELAFDYILGDDYITIKELRNFCNKEIDKGNENSKVFYSCTDWYYNGYINEEDIFMNDKNELVISEPI